MHKGGSVNLTVTLALLLLAMIIFLPSGAGSGALDREMEFMNALNNSLYHLDQAKWQWAEEKHKSDHDIPTMADLKPYLGNWTNHIERLVTLGIDFEITPSLEMSPQSDIATFTRDLYFRRGFCRFYPAGTRHGLQTGWVVPELRGATWFRDFYFNKRELLAAALFMLATANMLTFLIRKAKNTRQVSGDHV